MNDADRLLDTLLTRCTFASDGPLPCAFSGGADSTALVVLAQRAGLAPVAHHVDHGIRPESAEEAESARRIARALGVDFVLHVAHVAPGPNLEARARQARYLALPDGAATGHSADDQAETVVVRLLRGTGLDGLRAIAPGPTHPLLALRRTETEAVCQALAIGPVHDPSNDSSAILRNRVRRELVPLMSHIAGRDVVPLLARTAELLRADADALASVAAAIDPADARAVAAAEPALARRALRSLLTHQGYPPDAAAIERALAVAKGQAQACELPGGRRLERSGQRFRIVGDGQ